MGFGALLVLLELVAGLVDGGGGGAGLLRATIGLAEAGFLRRRGGAPGGRLLPFGRPFGGALMLEVLPECCNVFERCVGA